LKDIQNLSSKLRNRNLNESVMFEDEYEDFQNADGGEMGNGEPMQPQAQQTPVEKPEQGMEGQGDMKDVKPEEEGMKQLDDMGEVDQIREITLRGMTKLCKTPEAPEFQALLKIFQICNKSVSKDEIEENK